MFTLIIRKLTWDILTINAIFRPSDQSKRRWKCSTATYNKTDEFSFKANGFRNLDSDVNARATANIISGQIIRYIRVNS